ncbi:MAG: MFS transporter [Hyphomicrobiaceae bacterium]|nr:MFS transporter [Hyphomicrobiaceae bacterium]
MAQPFAEPCSRGLIAAQPCPRELRREIAPSRRRMVLIACVLASSMAFIDGSVLTVALPKLKAALGADLASVQWVVNGYVLALAALTLIGGALADAYGKARMLVLGCLLFGMASAGCALAPSIAWLVAARCAQGIAGAIVGPASLALIGATYPRAERSRAIGVWAAASALTTAGGPILGGWLIETFGWQFVFWINPPLALAAIALLRAYAPEDRREARRLDMVGAAMLAAALAALAWALSRIGSLEPQAKVMPSAGGATRAAAALFGLLGLAAYAWWERVSPHPMTPPRLVDNRPFLGLNLATLMIYASVSIMFFVLPFELVDRRGLSATDAGLAFLPFTLGVGLLSRGFGNLADATGARAPLIVGPVAAAVAYIWMALARDAPLWLGVIGPMTLLGLAFAAIAAPLTASVLSSVEETDEGLASGINNAVSRVAQLAGVAMAAGIATWMWGYELGLMAAAATSLAGALAVTATLPPPPPSHQRS